MFALVLQGQWYRQDSRLGFPSLDMFIRLTMDNVGWQCNYIANRYAERGRQICIVKRNTSSSDRDEAVDGEGSNKFYDASMKLNFTQVPDLRGKRINA